MLVGRYGIVSVLGGAIVLADQASKIWVLSSLGSARPSIEVAPFLNVVLVWNRGISFGVLNQGPDWWPWVLIAVAFLIVAGLLFWLRKLDGRWMVTAIGLIVGGAIGNVIDRFRFGAVVDFIDVHVSGWHFPTFNIADAAITCGVLILLADSLFGRQKSLSCGASEPGNN
ncbi:MAG: signal peptidase II [Rhodospirillaceae bacterium]|nr:signal peptidase II [Rhodospirillaceae bacterium]